MQTEKEAGAPLTGGPVDHSVRPAIAPRLPVGPVDRAVRAAHGVCMDNLNGTLTVSSEWLYDYSRLLLQQACEARLRSLGTRISGGSTREAVEDFLRPNIGVQGRPRAED